jgi:hypothetical protein
MACPLAQPDVKFDCQRLGQRRDTIRVSGLAQNTERQRDEIEFNEMFIGLRP